MSAPSDSATSSSPCACTNISLMQLFHELKQKFPGVPDHVVSNTIELYFHDKKACETHLHREVKASLTHAYHASSSAAARQLNELKANPPIKCRNQPIVKHDIVKSGLIKSTTCQGPQKAIISSIAELKDENPVVNTDNNQNVVEIKPEPTSKVSSPVTVNIDKCVAKYNADSPSDLELTNDGKDVPDVRPETVEESKQPVRSLEQPESTNYRIHKSNKIKSNLNEKLESVKEKKTIKKEEVKPPQEKIQRPNTLNFIKTNPDIAFNKNLKQPGFEPCRTVSPAPSAQKQEYKDQRPGAYRSERERGFPLNLSVNVNCHMDLSHSYGDPWLEDYESPRAITSVNLTVCTPTSNMASPVRDTRDDDSGFEGHVTVTVSPSTGRAPRRRAPPPPTQTTRIESPRFTRAAPEPPGQTLDRSLIERQKERLSRLANAVAQEKGRLAQLNQETQILAAPPPTPNMTQKLKEYVERLRDECDTLAKRLEMCGSARVMTVPESEDTGNFYSNIYTGQRPPSSWQCHMCTFRNHPLLDKCEECDMPRILVGTSPATTHDSGFGSFRDRNRRGANKVNTDVTDAPISNLASDCRAVNV